MPRLHLFFLVAFTANCTHFSQAQAQAFTESGLRSDVSKENLSDTYTHYVPKVLFDTDVNQDSVDETIKILAQLTEQKAEAIIIEWNTPGGSVDDGFRLAKAIESSPVPIVCVVDGHSASMGAYLLQSCHVRIMTKRSILMLHEPAMGGNFHGQPTEWRSIADWLKAMSKAMCEHMARRTAVTPAQIEDKIRGGAMWWMAWEEAKSLRFVDFAVDSVSDVTSAYRNHLSM